MRLFKSLLSVAALNGSADALLGGDDTTSTLLAWQILKDTVQIEFLISGYQPIKKDSLIHSI